MTSLSIAAVVVTYQSSSTIDACLARLRAAEGVSEIRVVDNASSDDTLDVVQRHALADPRVQFIANPDNPGSPPPATRARATRRRRGWSSSIPT